MKWPILLTLFGTVLCQYQSDITEFVVCSRDRACVEIHQCGDDNYILTGGEGQIGKRTGLGEQCDILRKLCCKIPGYSPPHPPPLDKCAVEYDCVPVELCNAEGKIITDGGGIIQKRIKPPLHSCTPKDYPGAQGKCCLRPDYPEHPTTGTLQNCFGDESCIYPADCKSPYYLVTGKTQPCFALSGDEGICCIEPKKPNPRPPVTVPPVEPWPKAPGCGFKNPRDIARIATKLGDTDSYFGEIPWQCIIFDKDYTFQCGCVIISETFILTVAHCVENYENSPDLISIRIGDYQVDTFDEPLPYEDHKVFKATIHPDYNARNNHNGIALIELLEPLTMKYHINSICLPSGPYSHFSPVLDYKISDYHHECFASGWGKDAFHGRYQALMKKVNLPLLDHNYCQDLLRNQPKLNKWFILDQGFLCAGGKAERDACKGDGGGPLSCYNTNLGRYEVVGLTSWGLGCGQEGSPGVYIDVQKFLPWIEKVVSHGRHFSPGKFTGYGK